MSDRLPPLTALRAFEAAARHMSFQNAADELNVTPAALSFQIKSLEEHLGHPVFIRLNRAVELTEAGRTLAPGVTDGFTALTAAWRNVQRLTDHTQLTVTAGPAFTAKWLAPRLYEFARAHPEIELRFSASLRLVDFDRDAVDVAIRFGFGPDHGLYTLPLAQEWMTPVMVPELATQYTTIDALTKAPLIIDQSLDFLNPALGWADWFHVVGRPGVEVHGPTFSQADHSVDAALAGVGVALGRRSVVIKDLAEGRLVAPFKTALNVGAQFRFLCPKGTETRPHIQAFRGWVLAEIAKTQDLVETFDVVDPA